MALAGAPRMILFDERPPLSPAERRDLGAPGNAPGGHHQSTTRRGAARRRARHHDAQRGVWNTARRRRSRTIPRCGDLPGGHMAEPALRSTTCTSITATPMPCRACPCSTAACSRRSGATAWARPRSATPSWAWCPSRAAACGCGQGITARAQRHRRTGLGYVPQGRGLALLGDGTCARRRAQAVIEPAHLRHLPAPRSGAAGGAEPPAASSRCWRSPRAARQPKLLTMDEPTEGLAPVIVEQVAGMLHGFGQRGPISVLLVEQNIGVAPTFGPGRTWQRPLRAPPAHELAADSPSSACSAHPGRGDGAAPAAAPRRGGGDGPGLHD